MPLLGIAPQFLVDDVDRALAYYRDKLGFAIDFQYERFYGSVSRDGCAIHLKHAPKSDGEREHRRKNEHLDAFVRVSDVRALYAELQTRGAAVTRALEDRPWNTTDFYVQDLDGYIICFSEERL